jgi:hypothetical protein
MDRLRRVWSRLLALIAVPLFLVALLPVALFLAAAFYLRTLALGAWEVSRVLAGPLLFTKRAAPLETRQGGNP